MRHTEELTPHEIAEQKAIFGDVSSLSDKELIMLILSDRKKGERTTLQLMVSKKDINEIAELSVNEITKLSGASKTQAAALSAACEFAKRIKINSKPETDTIRNNKDVENIFKNALSNSSIEEFWALYLTGTNKVIERVRISSGGTNVAAVDIKIILKRGIELLATSVIVAHNHPSGDTTPSEEDITLTRKIFEAAKSVDIRLLDHLIIGKENSYSFLEKGIMPK